MARRFLPVLLCLALSALTRAEITRVEITRRFDLPEIGYEKLVGTATFAVDPASRRNQIIADIDQAPRNASGRVEFTADICVFRPGEGRKGNGAGTSAAAREGYGNVFNPVCNVPQPIQFLNELVQSQASAAPRLTITMGDSRNRDLYFTLIDRFRSAELTDPAALLVFLRQIATERVGAAKAPDLLRLWIAIDEAARDIRLLNTGGYIFNLGCVQQRWLTRPFVPFPAELSAAEKSAFRKFQLQALGEDYANSLSDVQATDVYGGWSGKHFVRRVLDAVEDRIVLATRLAGQVGDENLAKRLTVFMCVLRNARGAVSYQAQLDRVKQLGIKPLPHAVIETQSDWDRQLMMETARAEIDNTAVLMDLLRSNPGEFLTLATTKEEEDIALLGPDILDQFQTKLNIMNSKWEDYKRVFTTPNW